VAGDLIPPPSPAGRPSPDPVPNEDPLAPATGVPDPAPAAAPPGPSPFRARFGFVTGALLGCAIAAGALALMLVTGGDDREEGLAPNWSAWKPSTTEPFNGALEIAEHIGRQYRDEKRGQLVKLTGGPPAVGSIPLEIAVKPRPDADILDVDGLGVQYTFNALGPSGSFRDGKRSSEERSRLLRREALELALYSFRYLPDGTSVLALLPPEPAKAKKGAAAKAPETKDGEPEYELKALLYRSGDLWPKLRVPLAETLSPKTPAMGEFAGEEARRVDSLTLSNLFDADYTRAQDAQAYLVLERPGS
jgi:hypothetical protein